jgi:hypothetical protein
MKAGVALDMKGTIMLITIYGNSPPPVTLCHASKVIRCCLLRKSNTANSSSAGAPKFGEGLENNVDITYHQRNSFIYGHTLVLNLHSMCAAHVTPFLSWFVTFLSTFPHTVFLLDFAL